MENERIKKVSAYFNEMKVGRTDKGGSFIAVEMTFPASWVIVDNLKQKFGVEANQYQGKTYFSTSLDNGFDKLFDAIDYNIEKMKAAEERKELLKEKTKELISLFSDENNSLNSLRKLVFGTETIEDNGVKTIYPFGKVPDDKPLNDDKPFNMDDYLTRMEARRTKEDGQPAKASDLPECRMTTTTFVHKVPTAPTTLPDEEDEEEQWFPDEEENNEKTVTIQ